MAIGTNSSIVLQEVDLKQSADFASTQGLNTIPNYNYRAGDCLFDSIAFRNLHDETASKETMQFFADNFRIENTILFKSSIARDNLET